MSIRGRRLGLAVALFAPPLVLAGRGPAPAAALVVASVAVITAGLLLVDDLMRRSALAAVSAPVALLLLYGTGLLWAEAAEPGLSALAFLVGAVAIRAWWPRAPESAGRACVEGAGGGLALLALALLTESATAAARLHVRHPVLLDSLFAPRHGLLFWTPALTAGVLGLATLAARGRKAALGGLTGLGAMALANAFLRPWWSGGFANARVLPALPLLAIGLGVPLEAVRLSARRRPLRLLAGAGALLVGWNLLLMAQYRAEMIPRDDTVAFPAVAENAARLVSAAVGTPAAWPANWVFAARERVPPARYDLLGGRDLLASLPAQIDLGDLDTSAALLGEGWSVRHACGTALCREVEGRARMFLPVVDPRPAWMRVRAQGAGTLRVSLNGTQVATGVLDERPRDVVAALPRERLRGGTNQVEFALSPGGHALIAAVRLVPAPEAP